MKKIIVIGAGASGLIAAISAAQAYDREIHASEKAALGKVSVTILEHMDIAGKKVLQTGNGRCNLTNRFIDAACYQNENAPFVMHIINKFTPDDAINFFNSLGLLTKSRSGSINGDSAREYIYPNSDQAEAVVNALLSRAVRLGINIEYRTHVKSIEKKDNEFVIETVIRDSILNKVSASPDLDEFRPVRTYSADAVILAAGSKAAPWTGSDGSGYALAESFGHTIIPPLPALVQLESSEKSCKVMAKARNDGRIRIYASDKDDKESRLIAESYGELQFTDYGISGIPVFQVSRHAVKALHEKKNVSASVDLLTLASREKVAGLLSRAVYDRGTSTVTDVLAGMLNRNVAKGIAAALHISPKQTMNRLSHDDINLIAGTVKDFRMKLSGYKSFDRAQVCQGGVSLEELNQDTLESKLVDGLYICGELLDVDGICGGYNLQWAWSSGYTAGRSAALRNVD